MARVFVSAVIHAPVDDVWRIIRRFNALPEWHPSVKSSAIEDGHPEDRVGCIRRFTQTSGAVLREQLCALDDQRHSVTYRIVEAALAAENYVSTIDLFPITQTDATLATWTATFDCPADQERQIVRDVEQVFLAGWVSLQRRWADSKSIIANRSQSPVRRVAVEEHFVTPEIASQWQALLSAHEEAEPGFNSFYKGFFDTEAGREIVGKLLDTGDGRIAIMDAAGIDVQVLSLTAPGVQVFHPSDASLYAARANDCAAEVVSRHPTRFRALGAIAPHDAKQAAKEIQRCMCELGFAGILINSHTFGEYLDSPKFSRVIEALEEFQAPLYLHPQTPSAGMLEPYLAYGLLGPAWGFAAETGLHALRLILSGILDRHPGLQIILGHLGEGLPWWLNRIDSRAAGFAKQLQRRPSEYVKSNFFITTSGMTDPARLQLAAETIGVDRILFAADYPYEDAGAAVRDLMNAPLSAGDRSKILYGNAENLFKLGRPSMSAALK